MSITIAYLKEHPEAIPILARIWHKVLGRIWVPDISIERVEHRFHEHLNDSSLPISFVAFDGNKPIGSVSLRENDGIRPDLAPWLGSLIVDTSYQKRGIGRLLIDTTKKKAAEMHFEKLYLFAFDPIISDYYARLGWGLISVDEFKEHPVTVMEIEL